MNKNERKKISALVNESAVIELTKTMLDKAIIDANESVRQFARLFDVDVDSMSAGEKKSLPAVFADGTETQLNLYRAKHRGDKRISIKGIKKQAKAGDTIAITYQLDAADRIIIVVNVTQTRGAIDLSKAVAS